MIMVGYQITVDNKHFFSKKKIKKNIFICSFRFTHCTVSVGSTIVSKLLRYIGIGDTCSWAIRMSQFVSLASNTYRKYECTSYRNKHNILFKTHLFSIVGK